jgi:hypothetical protein
MLLKSVVSMYVLLMLFLIPLIHLVFFRSAFFHFNET